MVFQKLLHFFKNLFAGRGLVEKEDFVFYISGTELPAPLNSEEELYYIDKLMQGDENAKQTLIEHNLRLVIYISKKFENTNIDIEDLISVGSIGLIKAINSFKGDKKIKLATYASRCIENEILMHFRSLKKTSQDISINEPIETDKEGNDLTLIDVIADDGNLFDDIDFKIKKDNLKKYINEVLTPREKLIICLRFGLFGEKENTQREVAKKLKISRSYVSRLEKKALTKLYNKFQSGGL